MTAITTSRPTNQELAPTGESPGRHWFKTVLTALLAGVLCLVLIGVTRTASALSTGKNETEPPGRSAAPPTMASRARVGGVQAPAPWKTASRLLPSGSSTKAP